MPLPESERKVLHVKLTGAKFSHWLLRWKCRFSSSKVSWPPPWTSCGGNITGSAFLCWQLLLLCLRYDRFYRFVAVITMNISHLPFPIQCIFLQVVVEWWSRIVSQTYLAFICLLLGHLDSYRHHVSLSSERNLKVLSVWLDTQSKDAHLKLLLSSKNENHLEHCCR